MNDQQKLSRGQFLALVGGMALTAVLFKFSSAKHVIAATGATARPTPVTYGGNTYGGKQA
jgi:hypothetical protein